MRGHGQRLCLLLAGGERVRLGLARGRERLRELRAKLLFVVAAHAGAALRDVDRAQATRARALKVFGSYDAEVRAVRDALRVPVHDVARAEVRVEEALAGLRVDFKADAARLAGRDEAYARRGGRGRDDCALRGGAALLRAGRVLRRGAARENYC